MPTWAWGSPSRVGWARDGPSAPAGGRPRGGAGAPGSPGLCGAACSTTPPPADGCRLQQRRRRLGVRRGLGAVPAAPGLAPDARPAPAPAPAQPAPSPGAASARLPAPSGRPAPASASSLLVSLSLSPSLSLRLPGHLLPGLPQRQFPEQRRTMHQKPTVPRPLPPAQPRPASALLAEPTPLGGSAGREGRGREGGRIPDSEEVTQPQWAFQPTEPDTLTSQAAQPGSLSPWDSGLLPHQEEVCANVSWDPVCL